MVCKRIKTCELKLSLKDFTDICVPTDVDRPGCPDGFTYRGTPDGWRHYIRIAYNQLHGTEE